MGDRHRIDLAAIDAALERLGAVDDPDDCTAGDDVPGLREERGEASPALRLVPPPPRRAVRAASRRPAGARPADLPALVEPPGYRRDRRGTWRYVASGRAVPGARDVTVASLWPTAEVDGVVRVAVDEVSAAAELAWCATVGDPTVTRRPAGRRTVTVDAFAVPAEEWWDRAFWPLSMTAPELCPDRLVGVDRAAEVFGVAPSTVTADLTRGRFPAPQVRVGGRPAWSLPVLLEARRARPGRW